MPSEQACCSPYYSVLRFFPTPPKGTVSATINIVALSFMAASVEVARWVYFRAGGRIAFHCLALIAGIVVIMLVSRLLKLRQQHLLQPA